MRLPTLLAFSWMAWVHRFGGPGLIVVAIIDNSFIPIPGGLDVATILLSSAHRDFWPYYGFMATLGAVVGGYLTFRIGRKGGKETLEKKIGRDKADKVYKKFEKHGFSTVVIGSIIPPPFPIVPILMAPGILKYPTRKFLSALALGRGIRYFAFAYIGNRYGASILNFFNTYRKPAMWTLIALAVLGGMAALVYFKYYRPKRRRQERQAGEPVEELPIPGKGNQKLNQNQETETDDKERKSA
jgi:membrane protein DedA with SNARE-associated domain